MAFDRKGFNTILLAWLISARVVAQSTFLPWGVHINYAETPESGMTIMWSTRSPVQASLVTIIPPNGSGQTFQGEAFVFSNNDNVQSIHRVFIVGLSPSTTYFYTVGDGQGNVSAVFHFTTAVQTGVFWNPTLAIYGDMGTSKNGQATVPFLVKDAQVNVITAVLHIGDMAYDLDSDHGKVGDTFMSLIEPLAATTPYHLCPGNHESNTDFYAYRMRFGLGLPLAADTPSSGGNGTFHSFNLGIIHIILLSSEVYFSKQPHSSGLLTEQAAWLAADLTKVDRNVTPFVILGLHQPFYCSPNDDMDDCHLGNSSVRLGLEKNNL